jgi:hypothetical protein
LNEGGATQAASEGIMANITQESGFNMRAGGGAGEQGLVQMRGDELLAYRQWQRQNNAANTPENQMRFLTNRLQTAYPQLWAAMNAPGVTGAQAGEMFLRGYERPAGRYLNQRLNSIRTQGVPGINSYFSTQPQGFPAQIPLPQPRPAITAPPAGPATPAPAAPPPAQGQSPGIPDADTVNKEYQNWLQQNNLPDSRANKEKFGDEYTRKYLQQRLSPPDASKDRGRILNPRLYNQATPEEQTQLAGNAPVPYPNAPGPGAFSSPPPPGMFSRPPERSIEESPFTPGPGLQSGQGAPYTSGGWPGGSRFDYNPPGVPILPNMYPGNPPAVAPPFQTPAREVSTDEKTKVAMSEKDYSAKVRKMIKEFEKKNKKPLPRINPDRQDPRRLEG